MTVLTSLVPHSPAIDLDLAAKYLTRLLNSSEAPTTNVTWQTFDDGPEPDIKRAKTFYGSLTDLYPELVARNDSGQGVFVCVNETDGLPRTADNVTALRAVYIDKDDGPVESYALTPSLEVFGPAGVHAYWLLRYGEDKVRFKDAQKALITYYRSDQAIHDLSRVLRVPGFLHRKGDPKSLTMRVGTDRLYTIDEILAAHNVVKTNGMLPKVPEGGVKVGRNNTLTSLAGSLRAKGFKEDAIRASLLEQNKILFADNPLPEGEVITIARSVSKYESKADTPEARGVAGFLAKRERGDTSDPTPEHPVVRAITQTELTDDEARWIEVYGEELAKPLPPVDWVVKELELASGRPHQFQGLSGSGKTLLVAHIGLSIASGTPVFGQHRAKRGDVLHLDYEMGLYASTMRYQRLAKGLGIDLKELGKSLAVVGLPSLQLTDPRSEDFLLRKCTGKTLVIFDALRGMIEGENENDSVIKQYLDKLLRVSDETKATFIFLHHTGKTIQDSTNAGRGSTGIRDGSGNIYLVEGQDQEPRNIKRTKPGQYNAGDPFEPVTVEFINTPKGDGVSVKVQVGANIAPKDTKKEKERLDMWHSILKCVKEYQHRDPNRPGCSANFIFDKVGGTRGKVLNTISVMAEDGVGLLRPAGQFGSKGLADRYVLTEKGESYLK